METTYKIVISQDNKIVEVLEGQKSDSVAFGKMLRLQGQSVDYALRYGGWKVEQINEQTGDSELWKYYGELKR
jgi:hypothetical protein